MASGRYLKPDPKEEKNRLDFVIDLLETSLIKAQTKLINPPKPLLLLTGPKEEDEEDEEKEKKSHKGLWLFAGAGSIGAIILAITLSPNLNTTLDQSQASIIRTETEREIPIDPELAPEEPIYVEIPPPTLVISPNGSFTIIEEEVIVEETVTEEEIPEEEVPAEELVEEEQPVETETPNEEVIIDYGPHEEPAETPPEEETISEEQPPNDANLFVPINPGEIIIDPYYEVDFTPFTIRETVPIIN